MSFAYSHENTNKDNDASNSS